MVFQAFLIKGILGVWLFVFTEQMINYLIVKKRFISYTFIVFHKYIDMIFTNESFVAVVKTKT